MIYLVMGVCGVGKSTVGQKLASVIGGRFIEGDDFHSTENKQKMQQGRALTDFDRQQWLQLLTAEIAIAATGQSPVVVACSALKASYREQLLRGFADHRIIFLHGPKSMLVERLKARQQHYMSPTLLDSQLAILELPEEAISVSIDKPVGDVVSDIAGRLWRTSGIVNTRTTKT